MAPLWITVSITSKDANFWGVKCSGRNKSHAMVDEARVQESGWTPPSEIHPWLMIARIFSKERKNVYENFKKETSRQRQVAN
jgi:hypothetical protein